MLAMEAAWFPSSWVCCGLGLREDGIGRAELTRLCVL
jgi:hypothetical protein